MENTIETNEVVAEEVTPVSEDQQSTESITFEDDTTVEGEDEGEDMAEEGEDSEDAADGEEMSMEEEGTEDETHEE